MHRSTNEGSSARSAPPRLWTVSLAVLLGAASALIVGVFLQADPDLWGHVRFGQLALDLGYVPAVDPYSFLSRPDGWINHEWLSEVVFAAGFDALGGWGLSLVPALVMTALVVGTFLHLIRRNVESTRGALLSALILTSLIVGGTVVRPHLFTYAAFFAVCLAIHHHERAGSVLPLALLPLIFPVWAAFHGGFLAGLGLLVLAAGASAYRLVAPGRDGSESDTRSLAAYSGCLLASAALTGLGPYGYDLPLFLLETATVPRPEITEWQPVDFRSFPGAIYLLLAMLTLYVTIQGRKKWSHVQGLVVLVLTLLPLTAVRHLPLFTLGFAVFVAPRLGTDLWVESGDHQLALRGPLSVLNLATAAALLWAATPELECIEYSIRGDPPRRSYPKVAVQELAELDDVSRLAVHFNWGEYLIWHLGPGVQVSVDGRRETVYSDSVYELNRSLMTGTDAWRRNLERIRADAALYPTDSPADNLLGLTDDWRLIHRDSTASLYLSTQRRIGHLATDSLTTPPDNTSLCFPE